MTVCDFGNFRYGQNPNSRIGSLMGAILAMKHYQNTFHTGLDGPKVSLVTSLYTV
jgi:hypothetical protein